MAPRFEDLVKQGGALVTEPAELAAPRFDDLIKQGGAIQEEPRKSRGAASAAVRGLLQGSTLGGSDEAGGAVQGGMQALANVLPKGALDWAGIDNRYSQPVMDTYRAARNDERRRDKEEAEGENGGLFTAAEVAGSVLPSMAPGLNIAKGASLASTVGKAALTGGLAGFGNSDAELTPDKVTGADSLRALLETGAGAGIGGIAGAAGHGIEKGLGWASQKLLGNSSRRAAKAGAKAAELADEAAHAETLTARSASGNKSTAAYKNVRNIMDTGAEGLLGPEERVVFERLKGELGESGRKGLVADAAEKEAAINAFREATATEAERAAQKKAELLKPSVKQSAKELFKMYAEPAIGTYLGAKLAPDDWGAAGGGIGLGLGLLSGRTRAGKAILNRIAKPGNQLAIANATRGLANFMGSSAPLLGAVERNVGRAVPATQSATPEYINALVAALMRRDEEQGLADL